MASIAGADWKGDGREALAATTSRFGKLDVLVNNAGVGGNTKVEDTTEAEWDRVMAINAKGVFLGTRVAIPEMRKAGGGTLRRWWSYPVTIRPADDHIEKGA